MQTPEMPPENAMFLSISLLPFVKLEVMFFLIDI